MTTEAAANLYLALHLVECEGRSWAVYNPHGKPVEELPVIYGFNNGGAHGMLSAVLVAQDGTGLGGHCCSSEGYMPHDLGVLEGSRPDRHQEFRAHYPRGYRMEFVGYDAVRGNAGLVEALRLNAAKARADDLAAAEAGK